MVTLQVLIARVPAITGLPAGQWGCGASGDGCHGAVAETAWPTSVNYRLISDKEATASVVTYRIPLVAAILNAPTADSHNAGPPGLTLREAEPWLTNSGPVILPD